MSTLFTGWFATGSRRSWRRALVPAGGWTTVVILVAGAGLAATPAASVAESGSVDPALGKPVPVTAAGFPDVDLSDLGDDQEHIWQGPNHAVWPDPSVAVVDPTENGAGAGVASVAAATMGDPYAPGWARFAAPDTPSSVRVAVLGRPAAEAVGVDGVLVSVDAIAGSGEVELSVDYSSFANAYGGAWASRLRLVELPACAATRPDLARCRAGAPAPSVNDTRAQRVSATVDPAGGSVFAVTADESSESGDWTATDLSPAGSWTHGGSSGGFTYSYPMRVPPAAGPVPELSLRYSSQAHDGLTSGTNNQASWLGDGWGYRPGFIERTYVPCAKDMDGGNNDTETGDLCWEDESPSITLSLNGVNTALVLDDDSAVWRAASDHSWRIERLGSPASPSNGSSERWVVTTADGTRHYFASEAGTSDSRLTVPVFGNHSGEPCRASQFEDSSCRQAYRWLLDKVVDTSGNVTRFYYERESGSYAAVLDEDNRQTYHRAARLARIDYGLRDGGSSPATGRVVFTAGDRCLDDCYRDGDPKASSWPDTPWDLTCESAPCGDGPWAPSFFSSKRLAKITTQVRDGSGFDDVDSWQLTHEFLDYGDESQVVMWLKSIKHTGHVGGTASMPEVSFTGRSLPNRVDHNGVPGVWRSRLSSITSATGGVTTVNYSPPDCGAGDLPAQPHSNTRLCYPYWWRPSVLTEPVMDWFHKYVVESVAEQETTATGGIVWTEYHYATSGGGTSVLWAWNDGEFTEDDHRTYSQWRGYPQVTTRVGDPADGAQVVTRSRFYRGMDGQRLPDGGERSVRLTDSEGGTVTDHRALAGRVWEEASYLGGSIDSATTYRYWTRRTAVRSHDGGDVEAWLTGVTRVEARQRLTGTTWQRTRVDTSYDNRGRVVEVHDRGDLAGDDQRCTRTEYAENTTKWILDAVARSETVAVGCDAVADRPNDVITDQRVFYDGSGTLGAPPSQGLPTEEQQLAGWDGGPVYVTVRETGYDALGRAVRVTDALGRTTATAYTPAGAGPVTRTVTTNPLGHESTTHFAPAWGETTATVDPNGRRTDIEYDPLGRRVAVWLPGLDRNAEPPDPANLRFSYDVNHDTPSAVTTRQINASGGYVTSVVLFDSLLREIQKQTETPRGGRLVTETAYNTRGEVEFSSGPNWDDSSGPETTFVRVEQGADHARTWFTYDPLGREIKAELWSKNAELWEQTTAYGGSSLGFLTRVTPPEGGVPTGEIVDARGNVIEKRDYHGGTATGTYDATSYAYEQGRLVTVTDPVGNTWDYEYDLRGRTVAVHDPDSGTTAAEYDDAGRLIATTDARGETVSTVYDELDRTIQRWHGQVGAGEQVAAWTYDTLPGGAGLPATASAFVDGHEIRTTVGNYDAAGRPTLTVVNVPPVPGLEALAGSYMSIQRYNLDGTVATLALPAVGGLPREGITYTYNDLGLPDRMVGDMLSLGDTQVYVDSTSYTAHAELAQRTLGASYENQVYHTYSYADGTRRRQDFRLSRDAVGVTNVAHLQYEYDDVGNILSIADAVEDAPGEAERQCFVYDHLRRLTEAWAQAGTGPCADQPATQALGGPAPYWSSYTFDVTGNRLSETRHDAGGGSQIRSYAYPPAGGAQPHTVTSVTTGSQVDTYTYDPAGNTTDRAIGGRTETIEWNAAGKPVSITDGSGAVTRMIYQHDGERVARIDGNGDAHLFVAGHEITYSAATGVVSAVRRYEHNGDVIAVRSSASGLQWVAGDHHGTATWAISATSMAVTYRRQDPYGNPRGPQSPWPAGQQGFVGGVTDPSGLVHIGARSYDPLTGRFISSDPITDFSDLQQINGYTYANGNPVTSSDPTGLRACIDYCGSEADRYVLRQKNARRSHRSGSSGREEKFYWTPDGGRGARIGSRPTAESTPQGREQIWDPMLSMSQEEIDALYQTVNDINLYQALLALVMGAGGTQNYYQVDQMTMAVRGSDAMSRVRVMLRWMLRGNEYAPEDTVHIGLPYGDDAAALQRLVADVIVGAAGLVDEEATAAATVAALGSFDVTYRVMAIDEEAGRAVVAFEAHNVWGMESLTRQPVGPNAGEPVLPGRTSGAMADVEQNFYWAEVIDF